MKHVAEDIVRGQPHGPVSARTSCPDSNSTPESTSPNRLSCTDEQNLVPESASHRVFVYGTLKFGQPNHYHFDSWKNSGKCRFVGKARSAVPFPLIVATRWNLPFLLFEPGKGKIIDGEVYDVDDGLLAWMDWFEGHPGVYQRDRIAVNLIDHSSTTTPNSSMHSIVPTSGVPADQSTVPDASALDNSIKAERPPNASLKSDQNSGGSDQTDKQNHSTTCWVYFLKKYTPVLLSKDSHVSFDAFGLSGKHYCPDKDLKGPKDIEDGLSNETPDNNNGAVVNSNSPDLYSNCYKELSGIQDVAEELAKEVDNMLMQ